MGTIEYINFRRRFEAGLYSLACGALANFEFDFDDLKMFRSDVPAPFTAIDHPF